MQTVPTIDLQKAASDESALNLLDAACRDHGFFLLKNHGITSEIEAMWRASSWFFSQPKPYKQSLARSEENALGYYDRELTKQRRDLKEVFDYMQPRSEGPDLNQWPMTADDEQAEEFKEAQLEFFVAASDVAEQTLQLVFSALSRKTLADLPSGAARTSNVRLNYYPTSDPLSEEEQRSVNDLGDLALHPHTDPGILTLLLQDMTGGLQTESQSSGWIDVPPEGDTIVVNLGDAMQVWTNDEYVAAVHRVVSRTTEPRYSTPYFYNPAGKTVLEPLAGLSTADAKFHSFTWKEYIQGRIDDNYTDLGEDDIQIDRFRIQN